MLVAVLGDIHGNYLALRKVLDEIRKERIEYLFITGDIVGYYYHPDMVFKELANWSYQIIQGNHDRMFIEIYNGNKKLKLWYKKTYGSGIDCALSSLYPETRSYLSNLPVRIDIRIEDRKILLCHGSPWNSDEYIYPDSSEETLLRCASENFDIVLMGHTHYPMEKRINSTLLLNPGSVGQPRNYSPGAHWAILDLETSKVKLKNSAYDIGTVVAEAKQKDPELPYLAEVLIRRSKNTTIPSFIE